MRNPLKAKLFHFTNNDLFPVYRPPYYGTFRKRSKFVTPRRPFSIKEPTLNYEVDSDLEWEEEPSDAEECKSDEEENEDASEDEDDGFFVDHGYLSPDEGASDAEEKENLDTEDHQKCLEAKATAFKDQQKRRKERTKVNLKPAIYGPKWVVPFQDEEELANPFFKFLLRGILFDYTNLKIDSSSDVKKS